MEDLVNVRFCEQRLNNSARADRSYPQFKSAHYVRTGFMHTTCTFNVNDIPNCYSMGKVSYFFICLWLHFLSFVFFSIFLI